LWEIGVIAIGVGLCAIAIVAAVVLLRRSNNNNNNNNDDVNAKGTLQFIVSIETQL
jgi:hypothetical protein